MHLATRLRLYLVVLHLGIGGALFWLLWTRTPSEEASLLGRGGAIIVAEVLFLTSFVVGWRLISAFFRPLHLVSLGADLVEERDFSSTFRPIGEPRMDRLIEVYNRMIVQLREERLHASEQEAFLDHLVEASPTGILITDLDGNISRINPSGLRLLGLSSALDGATASKNSRQPSIKPGDLPSPWGGVLASLEIGQRRRVSLPEGRQIRCQAAELRDRGFSRTFYLLDELTDELRENEKAAYEKLIRLVSHEVNNSVGAVTSLLAAMAHFGGQIRDGDRQDFEHAVGVASDRLERLRAFVDGFAEVIRLPEPHLRRLDLGTLLHDLATLLRPSFQERGVELRYLPPAAPLIIEADQIQLEQVLINILENAADAIESVHAAPSLEETRPGRTATGPSGQGASLGTVVVRVDRNANGWPRLTVDDEGPGIDPEVAGKLFTPFFTTKPEGRGLGLTMTKEVLDRHGFAFSLTSRQEASQEREGENERSTGTKTPSDPPTSEERGGGRFRLIFEPRAELPRLDDP